MPHVNSFSASHSTAKSTPERNPSQKYFPIVPIASWYIGKGGSSSWKKVSRILSMPFSSLLMMRRDARFLLGKLYKTYNKTFGVPKSIAAKWEEIGFLTNKDQYVGWGSMIKYCQELYAVADALGVCKFTTSWRFGLGPEEFARAVSVLFDKKIDWREVLEVGERITAVERLLMASMGPIDDSLPRRFFDGDGAVDEEKFITMVSDYYARCSYSYCGVPSASLVDRLGINFSDKFFSKIVSFGRHL